MNRFPKFAEYFNGLLKENEPKTRQVEVAEKLGITQGTLSKLKVGIQLPSEELAGRISKIWNVPDFVEKVIGARQEDTLIVLESAEVEDDKSRLSKEEQFTIAKIYIREMSKTSRGREILEKLSTGVMPKDLEAKFDEILNDVYNSLINR